MKKFVLTLIVIFISAFCCACDNEKSHVFFNTRPFDAKTVTNNTNIFKPNQRIYYLITLPKPVQTQRLLIQIVKTGSNERLGYELVWGKQVKIRDEQIYYFTDYVVMSETGLYIMKVYSKDEPTKLLTSEEFFVKN